MMDKINKNTEEGIFRQAIEAFEKNVLKPVEYKIMTHQPELFTGPYRPDFLARTTIQGIPLDYVIDVKINITKVYVYMLLARRQQLPYPLLIVTRHVNPRMAEELKKHELDFIDMAGNAYINKPPLYIYVTGNKLKEPAKPARSARVFMPAGLKMIYAILCTPGLENKTVREIAAVANVAVGTVDWIMKELQALGFLIAMGKQGYKVIQKEWLFQRWVTAYPEQLRPKQLLGRFKGQIGWWQNTKLDPLQAQWGGEIAAERLTHYLQPQTATIYTAHQHLDRLLIENKLKKDITGDIEILERFCPPNQAGKDLDLVHPILVYADLLATGDPRNIETAKMIYEAHIVRLVRQD